MILPPVADPRKGHLLVHFGPHVTNARLQEDELSPSADRYMTPDSPLGPSNLKCSHLYPILKTGSQDLVSYGQGNLPLVGPAGPGSWDLAEKGGRESRAAGSGFQPGLGSCSSC